MEQLEVLKLSVSHQAMAGQVIAGEFADFDPILKTKFAGTWWPDGFANPPVFYFTIFFVISPTSRPDLF